MEQKRDHELDQTRNRGGVADIGTKEDGAIKEMININERLITIKEYSIYEFVLADTLDPGRERPNLPASLHKKVLDRGSADPIVARVFLTAKALFFPSHYYPSIDVNKGLLDILDVTRELIAMQTEIDEYNIEHSKACNIFEERKGVPGFMLPSIPDMLTRCKTVFQKADHACQYMMTVIRLFYPEKSENAYYIDFEKSIRETYGETDSFSRFLEQVVPFIMEVRLARNCFDHRRVELRLIGFELQDDGSVLTPTIEMNHLGSVIVRQDLQKYLLRTLQKLVYVIEQMIPYLASKHIGAIGKIVPQIREVPEDKRRQKLVRFGIWLPLGEEGYYAQ